MKILLAYKKIGMRFERGHAALMLVIMIAAACCISRAASAATPREKAAVDEFLSLVGPKQGRQAGRQSPGRRDLTMAAMEVARSWDSLSQDDRDRLKPYMNESAWRNGSRTIEYYNTGACSDILPEASNLTRDTAHFRAIYTLTGSNASTLAFIDNILSYFEHSWDVEITLMGYPAPKLPPDGKFRLYFCNLEAEYPGIYGVTWTETKFEDHTASAHIELDNDYASTTVSAGLTINQLIQVTAAHEFFHSIQFGMNFDSPSPWLMEASATWMEDEVYPDVNDYVIEYLQDTFRNLDVPIDHYGSDDLQYGESIFFRHLTENVADPAFMLSIWNNIETTCANPSNATWCTKDVTETPLISDMLTARSTGMGNVFQTFSAANLLKGYRDGRLSSFPAVSISTYTAGTPFTLDHLAAKFYRLTNAGVCSNGLPATVQITVTAAGDIWRATVVRELTGGGVSVTQFTPSGGTGTFSDGMMCADYTSLVLIVNNVSLDQDGRQFTLNATFTPGSYTQFSHNFPAGWNMIGAPFTPAIPAPQRALGLVGNNNIMQLSGGVYKDYTALDPAAPGSAYWVYLPQAETLMASGVDTSVHSIFVKTGWNLAALPFNATASWSSGINVTCNGGTHALGSAESDACISPLLYTYDSAADAYNTPKSITDGYTINPWEGFIVRALHDCELQFPTP